MSVFKLKDFTLLRNSMLNYISYSSPNLTDMTIGSNCRSIIEAIAMEGEELYFRLWQGVQAGIQESILQTFGFEAATGIAARGSVAFTRETVATVDYLIPAGTQVISSSGIVYETTTDVTLLQGTTTITASVLALQAGVVGNIPTIGTKLQLVSPITGVSSAVTATQITGGSDTEPVEAVLERFSLYINSLVRGTKSAIEYGAKSTQRVDADGNILEAVSSVQVIDNPATPGLVTLYIDNGTGDPTKIWSSDVPNPIKIDNSTFRVSGDNTSIFTPWTRVRIKENPNTYVEEYVISSTYSPVTGQTTVNLRNAVLTALTTINQVVYLTGGLLYEVARKITGYRMPDGTWIDGYKAAGCWVDVQAVDKINVSVNISIAVRSDFNTIKPYVETAVTNYFSKLNIGDNVNKEKLSADCFYAHPDILDVIINSPAADITVGNGKRAFINGTIINKL